MPTSEQKRKQLKKIVAKRRATLLPGAANALTARIAEDLGFEAVYLTGAGVTNTNLGMPDLGLITPLELADVAARIGDVCGLPLAADIDTGFGSALNAYRTVQVMERVGVAALQIEDQTFPKKCGHFTGKDVVPLDDFLSKVKACLDARVDANLQIIARTDARAVVGFEAALERAAALAEIGADIIFVEAPQSIDEIQRIGALPSPQLINIVVGGLTPMLPLAELEDAGFSLVLYANAALQASMHSISSVLGHLKKVGSLQGAEHQLARFAERQRLVRKDWYDALEQSYKSS